MRILIIEIIKSLHFGITNPLNKYATIKVRSEHGAATDGFRKIDAIKLNIDTDTRWTRNRIKNWLKNLKVINKMSMSRGHI